MQLNGHRFVRGALAAAACTALGQAGASESPGSWQVDSALLSYSEEDRVSVFEPVVYASHQVSDDLSYTLRAVHDTMTGATPNGAAPSSEAQTITSASGSSTTVAAGELPLMEFSDERVALGLDITRDLSRLEKQFTSYNISRETDYLSVGGSLTQTRDTSDRMRTYTHGLGVSLDMVSPASGVPPGLQPIYSTTTSASGGGEDDDEFEDDSQQSDSITSASGDVAGALSTDESLGKMKLSADAIFGVTQVMSRRSLLQSNIALSVSGGYLTDPYKMLSLVDSSGLPTDYVWEQRPDLRAAVSLYNKWVYHLPKNVLHLSYRWFQDSWGIQSHTADLTYHITMGGNLYLEPHARYYIQTAADFYYSSLPNWQPLPTYASADYRLAAMDSTTVGIKLGKKLSHNGEISLRMEKMIQSGIDSQAGAIGTQDSVDLYPGLNATIIQLSFSIKF